MINMAISKIKEPNVKHIRRFSGQSYWYVGTWSGKEYTELQAYKMKKYAGVKKYRIIKIHPHKYRLYVFD